MKSISRTIALNHSLKKISFLVFFTAFTVMFFSNITAFANNKSDKTQQEAKDFIKTISAEALSYLNDETIEKTVLFDSFKNMLTTNFNVKYIGKMSLGRYRKNANKADLEKYYDIFPDYLVSSYLNALGKLRIENFTVRNAIPYGKKDIFVRTRAITSKGKTADIDWRIRTKKNNDGFLIIDVKVEGISQVRTQRDDFSALILKSKIKGLTDFMETIINDSKKTNEPKEVTQEDNLRQTITEDAPNL